MNTRALAERDRITATVKPGAPTNPNFPNADAWTVTLRRGKSRLTVPFYQGRGHHGRPPEAYAVLDCLLMDASSPDDLADFLEECGYLGRGINAAQTVRDGIRAHAACLAIKPRLRAFLGAAFDEYMEAERL